MTLLIQLPVFIGLYTVVRYIAQGEVPMDWLYSFFRGFGNQFVGEVNVINTNFLGIDLLANKNRILTVLVVILNYGQMQLTQLIQPKQTSKLPGGANMPDMQKMMGTMSIGMSAMMGVMVFTFQSAIGLYLVTTSLFSVCQYSRQYRAVLKAKINEFLHKGKPTIINPKE